MHSKAIGTVYFPQPSIKQKSTFTLFRHAHKKPQQVSGFNQHISIYQKDRTFKTKTHIPFVGTSDQCYRENVVHFFELYANDLPSETKASLHGLTIRFEYTDRQQHTKHHLLQETIIITGRYDEITDQLTTYHMPLKTNPLVYNAENLMQSGHATIAFDTFTLFGVENMLNILNFIPSETLDNDMKAYLMTISSKDYFNYFERNQIKFVGTEENTAFIEQLFSQFVTHGHAARIAA